MNFNPFNYKFNIPVINSKLIHLFVLATTLTRQLLESKRIQHTLNVYSKIMQPDIWAQWVRAKVDIFKEETITKSQDFMNTVNIKYNKIISSSTNGKLQSYITSVHDDIVAMFAKSSKSGNKRKPQASFDTRDDDKRPNRELPSFLTYFRDLSQTKYKLGGSKKYEDNTY